MKPIKESASIRDEILIQGGLRGEKKGGLRSHDGKPVDPKVIAAAFGVDIEEAKDISRRLSL
jgi:hypothetical protein